MILRWLTQPLRPPAAAPEREELTLPDGPLPVCWRRNGRARRVTLRICPAERAVVITLPARAGRRQGLALLSEHGAWARERLAALAPRLPFRPGAEVPLLGRPHVIRHLPEARRGVWLEPGAILVSGEEAHLPRRVSDFLRAEARREVGVRAHPLATRIERRIARIVIKDPRSRWGSCAPDGTLAFSWRLVLAPAFVLDYVVAHEVAHLAELNHSARFWRMVGLICPDPEPAKAWLSAHGPDLLRYG